ncbi:arsenate reductase (glutaredoxin) [Psychrosphaera sp. B3R10]|uniref:Arsenate reductase n=1 Tax=Psychrosphaera algicola TaxID=3023714 RepID=A0ABT5FC29_9GAMM|nr:MULTISPECIES: arsenate reductase (glutaredoxin) [unclassified Psychrosphaera]MBU2881250.1 arsenate reductase (glutaredoxin) [Psychrosphaera sp. I2R16]MBU2988349.1 arsenate reductase (glutaredoxin) [Psychrosphaera sp. B3R10]MDC2888125.1 arsenate reductase (glutaredoxin) [Psychrosphaera sp. G1-22]MDO6720154.1 arsenate reductase (glutaredoxin) [Psychrosphaera sp. 1_MG-2023]
MSLVIYHNPRCSKSRQTLELVQQKSNDIEVIEYLKTPPSAEELTAIIAMLGISARTLIRTKETEYKTSGLEDKSLTDQQVIELMVNNPKVIERPIVVANGKAAIGRPPENVLDIL